jgi:hypothetical protein
VRQHHAHAQRAWAVDVLADAVAYEQGLGRLRAKRIEDRLVDAGVRLADADLGREHRCLDVLRHAERVEGPPHERAWDGDVGHEAEPQAARPQLP